MTKKSSFVLNRIKSIGYAFNGACYLIKNEKSIQVQFGLGIIMTIAGFYYNISAIEWMIQILLIGVIMTIEGVNSVIEEIADFIHPEFHKKIGLIKDISAGAVFIFAIAASIIGLIIYIPKIF